MSLKESSSCCKFGSKKASGADITVVAPNSMGIWPHAEAVGQELQRQRVSAYRKLSERAAAQTS